MPATMTPTLRADLKDRRVQVQFEPQPTPDSSRLVFDVYSAESNQHPEMHMGWWTWPTAETAGATAVRLEYHAKDTVEVYLEHPDGDRAPSERWFNPEFRLPPLLQATLFWQNEAFEASRQATTMIGVHDEALLQEYYADNSRRYAVVHPFSKAFHQRRLDVLGRVFRRYIPPGSRLLDVGSGYSIFSLIGDGRWPYQIACIDLDRAMVGQAAPTRPNYGWSVGMVQHLPFADNSFDALYAGEVIEHVPAADAALAEWRRVLRPGGTIVVTTPNRERLLNRVNQAAAPVSPEHLLEFTVGDLEAMFGRNGFEVRYREGIYLELLALWRQRPPYLDPITVAEPMRRHLLALQPLMRLARPLPQLAYNLVFVGRKT